MYFDNKLKVKFSKLWAGHDNVSFTTSEYNQIMSLQEKMHKKYGNNLTILQRKFNRILRKME
jgi:hypothetical protein